MVKPHSLTRLPTHTHVPTHAQREWMGGGKPMEIRLTEFYGARQATKIPQRQYRFDPLIRNCFYSFKFDHCRASGSIQLIKRSNYQRPTKPIHNGEIM